MREQEFYTISLAMDKSLVTKATSPDEVPTPGYMFNEIARITQASADACKQLEEFLMKRLKKDNVHVKLKVLRVVKHCCLQGHMTFRRDMQRHTSEVKECLGYRGTADALHGDALNKAVRDAAQEVMTAIFDTTTQSEQLQNSGRMQAFGSNTGPVGCGGGAGSDEQCTSEVDCIVTLRKKMSEVTTNVCDHSPYGCPYGGP